MVKIDPSRFSLHIGIRVLEICKVDFSINFGKLSPIFSRFHPEKKQKLLNQALVHLGRP